MRRLLIVFVAGTLIQGCDAGAGDRVDGPPAPPEPVAAVPPPTVEGFAHQAGADLFGYYLPVSDVQVGDLKLSHLHIGDEAEFQAWEAAQGRGPTNFAPIMFQFDDLSSPTVANELGGQTPEVIVRVLPTGYGVSDGIVRFVGTDPTLGLVIFEGRFVAGALQRERTVAEGQAVLQGNLTIGDRIFEGQSFSWIGGD